MTNYKKIDLLKTTAKLFLPPVITHALRQVHKPRSLATKGMATLGPPKPPEEITDGKIVEFIGPSGVGKTYIFRHALENFSDRYITRPSETKIQDHLVLDYGPHWNLLVSKVKSIGNKNLNDFQRAKLLQYFSQVLVEDIKIRIQLEKHGFFLDEGLVHNFSKDLTDIDDPEFYMAMSSRIIIMVSQCRLETVLERRRLRFKETGHIVTYQSGLSRTEELQQIELDCMRLEKLAYRAEQFGCPVLRITAEDPMEKNISLILRFEKNLIGAASQKPVHEHQDVK